MTRQDKIEMIRAWWGSPAAQGMSGRAGARACAEALQLPFNSVRNLQVAAFPAVAPWHRRDGDEQLDERQPDEQLLAEQLASAINEAAGADTSVVIEYKTCPKCKAVKPLATAFGVRKVWRRGERVTIPQSYCNACR